MIGALLSLLRRVPVVGSDGMLVGRELGGATVGLIGMAPAARSMTQMLSGFKSHFFSPNAMPRNFSSMTRSSNALCNQTAESRTIGLYSSIRTATAPT